MLSRVNLSEVNATPTPPNFVTIQQFPIFVPHQHAATADNPAIALKPSRRLTEIHPIRSPPRLESEDSVLFNMSPEQRVRPRRHARIDGDKTMG
jgi:hypothetical protein